MPGTNFPVSDYYKDHIVDALTVSRAGGWWTAVLVIEHPTTKKRFICLYRWQLVDGTWKTRDNLKINSKRDADKFIEVIGRLSDKM